MPKFLLEVKAQLQGVAAFSVDHDSYPWYISLRCGSCGEETRKPVVVSRSDNVEGVRGASVGMKISCKLCSRTNDITILPGKSEYTSTDSPSWKPFLEVEARGTEPTTIEFSDEVPLSMKGEGKFAASDALIVDGEYYGYDEELSQEISVTEFETRVVKKK
jgi:Eukaryotic protein of unknown function (DUF866)